MNISVCILTYKRLEGLRLALQSLATQKSDEKIYNLCQVIVVDNEVNPEVELLCGSTSTLLGLNISYIREPKRGISFARNSAVKATNDYIDCIAFLDDDEEAASDWLYELALAMQTTNADIITGNVVSIFNQETPDWLINGRFLDRFIHRHLEKIDYARTGNVLIKLKIFEKCGYFDENFALTGGEDTIFFHKANASGAKIIWSSKATVYESVENSRLNTKWLLRRTFRSTGTSVISDIMLSNHKALLKCKYFLLGLARIFSLLLTIPIAVLCGYVAIVRAIRISARGLGMVLGVFGYHHKEYVTK